MISDVTTVLMRDFAANMQNRIVAIERGDVRRDEDAERPRVASASACARCVMALSRLFRRLFLPYRPAAS